MQCPLCLREGVKFESHHLQTRRKDKADTKDICVECHKTIHGLFSNTQLRDDNSGLGTVEGLIENEEFAKALKFIKKVPPGAHMSMKSSKSKRRKR